MTSMAKTEWPSNFGPSYTPEQMLRRGIFEGVYIQPIRGLPSGWKSLDKVLPSGTEPDVTINEFGVKSSQPKSEWVRKGWIMTDSEGWFHWYIKFFLGRRLGEEDDKQIGRWRSFVARHAGQLKSNCSLGDTKCSPKQRQGLLQWAWDSRVEFTEKTVTANARRMANATNVKISTEEYSPIYIDW